MLFVRCIIPALLTLITACATVRTPDFSMASDSSVKEDNPPIEVQQAFWQVYTEEPGADDPHDWQQSRREEWLQNLIAAFNVRMIGDGWHLRALLPKESKLMPILPRGRGDIFVLEKGKVGWEVVAEAWAYDTPVLDFFLYPDYLVVEGWSPPYKVDSNGLVYPSDEVADLIYGIYTWTPLYREDFSEEEAPGFLRDIMTKFNGRATAYGWQLREMTEKEKSTLPDYEWAKIAFGYLTLSHGEHEWLILFTASDRMAVLRK